MRLRRRRSLPLALLLACALLGAQGLGSWHRIAHAPGLGDLTAAAQPLDSFDHGLAHSDGQHGDHGHDYGHGHDRGSADCRLLDQLLGAAPLLAAPGATLILTAPGSAPEPTPGLAPHASAWRQPAARGPPPAA